MTCDICLSLKKFETQGFSTQLDFTSTMKEINDFVQEHKISESKSGLKAQFVCNSCAGIWDLSRPDGAMRGRLSYLSPNQQRIQTLRSKRAEQLS